MFGFWLVLVCQGPACVCPHALVGRGWWCGAEKRGSRGGGRLHNSRPSTCRPQARGAAAGGALPCAAHQVGWLRHAQALHATLLSAVRLCPPACMAPHSSEPLILSTSLAPLHPCIPSPPHAHSYEIAAKEAADLGKLEWEALVVDEGHRLKNSEARWAGLEWERARFGPLICGCWHLHAQPQEPGPPAPSDTTALALPSPALRPACSRCSTACTPGTASCSPARRCRCGRLAPLGPRALDLWLHRGLPRLKHKILGFNNSAPLPAERPERALQAHALSGAAALCLAG